MQHHCEWCSTTGSKRWHTMKDGENKRLCHSCYRSVRNGYVACSGCATRRFCRRTAGGDAFCFLCQKINYPQQENRAPTLFCKKCGTTKSMDWHTTITKEHVCLYCFREKEQVDVFGPKKKKLHHNKHSIVTDDEDDIEIAASMLCDLLVTLRKV